MNSYSDTYLLIGLGIQPLGRNALKFGHKVFVGDHIRLSDAPLLEGIYLGRGISEQMVLSRLVKKFAEYQFKGVIFGDGFEQQTYYLEELNNIAPLLGTNFKGIRSSKDPEAVTGALKSWSVPFPKICYNIDPSQNADDWIAKPILSSKEGRPLLRKNLLLPEHEYYYQERIDGIRSKAIIVSDGNEASVISIMARFNDSLIVGKEKYNYSGVISPHPFSTDIQQKVAHIADALTMEFEIKGIWEFDFIYNGDVVLVDLHARMPTNLDLLNITTMNDFLSLHIDASLQNLSHTIIDPGDLTTYNGVAYLMANKEINNNNICHSDLNLIDPPSPNETIGKNERLATIRSSAKGYYELLSNFKNDAKHFFQRLEVTPASVQ